MQTAKALALKASSVTEAPVELASSVFVLACAAALILAGQPLPL